MIFNNKIMFCLRCPRENYFCVDKSKQKSAPERSVITLQRILQQPGYHRTTEKLKIKIGWTMVLVASV